MTREELTNRIYELHEQVKKSDMGEFLVSRVQLEGQLKNMNIETLRAVARFYEALNEPAEN